MRRGVTLVVVATLLLAGCLGGEGELDSEDKEEDQGGVAKPTETTGSIRGQVVDGNFEVIAGLQIVLTRDGDIIATQYSTAAGRYAFNDLEPGGYRLIADDPCCNLYAENVRVEVGETTEVDLQLQRIRTIQTSVNTDGRWHGFMGCSYWVPLSPTTAYCPDPNNDVQETFTANPGLKTIVVAVVWEQGPNTLSEKFRHTLHRTDDPSGMIATQNAGSPIQYRVDANHEGTTTNFNESVDPMEFRFQVGAGGTELTSPGFAYQQEFWVYWHLYYGEHAPPGASALPDA